MLEGDVARLTQLVEEVSWDLKHAESAVRDLVTRNSELEGTCEELEHRLQVAAERKRVLRRELLWPST